MLSNKRQVRFIGDPISSAVLAVASGAAIQEQKLIPLLVFDGSVATAISCPLWLVFYSQKGAVC